jgi:transposase InsO family protein
VPPVLGGGPGSGRRPVTFEDYRVLSPEEVRKLQIVEYGTDGERLEEEDYVRDEDGIWCRVLGRNDVRVLVPPKLREQVLKMVHGSKIRGHWGILKTAAMVRSKCYWDRWAADVEHAVARCLACEVVRLRNPKRQVRMVMHHPSRRFELLAVDVLEMTPVTPRGNRKVLVIGDMFTRFIMALAMPDDKAETVSLLLVDRWVTLFGPPEQLLSDQGRCSTMRFPGYRDSPNRPFVEFHSPLI